MRHLRRLAPDIGFGVGLLLLLLIFFFPQTLGGRTLLPAENLYQYAPYSAYRDQAGAPEIPQNHLLSDLVLQNYQWKSFIRDQISIGEVPLWNPHQFSGIPFLAAGQHSAFYPLSAIYYLLDLPLAYGWFTVINLWLAGIFAYMLARGLGISRAGASLAGVIYPFSGFTIASVVFQMMIGGLPWLPLMLLMVEFVIRRRPLLGSPTVVPWIVIGATALGMNVLAGHAEITIYSLFIAGYFAAGRLLVMAWQQRSLKTVLAPALALVVMIALGLALGALQLIPLYEFVQTNWRAERADLATVLSYAHPLRDVVQFILPNFYGNPSHHAYFDLFSLSWVDQLTNASGQPITFIDWGIKNYVEGALYLGILPLILAAYALLDRWWFNRVRDHAEPPYRGILASLSVISLAFMFGLPLYGLIYGLPGINQLNSPFRWVYALTIAVALLAGFGLDALQQHRRVRRIGWWLLAVGAALLIALIASWLAFGALEPLVDRVFRSMAKAVEAFSDARAFYSYQFVNALVLSLMLLASGLVIALMRRWRQFAVLALPLLVAADLMIASWGFNPASDPALLDFQPPAMAWLQEQEAQQPSFRYTTLDDWTQPAILNANMTWRYGLDDVRGYDSIIPRAYVDYMRAAAPQGQLDFNRIAPLFVNDLEAADGAYVLPDRPLLNLLNVRYIVAHAGTALVAADGVALEPVYADDELAIFENAAAVPRAYTVPQASFRDAWLPGADGQFDYAALAVPDDLSPAAITRDTGREKFVNVTTSEPVWLVISETYMPGWRAFVREQGAGEDAESPSDVGPVLGNSQGLRLPPGDWTVRLVYSPSSFQVGLFGSVIALAALAFLLGVWFWRLYVGVNTDESSQAARVARNSVAPIILNLFNRGIDFAFAIVMLRVLSPEDVGVYYFAIVIFVWFDIFTNFGLDVFLMREASRDRDAAGHTFYNTTLLRGLLSAAGIPLLVGFLALWQASGVESIARDGLIALGLLYLGLFPSSLSKGMTSLFYAYERAEYPAAIATITTINKAIFGVIVLMLGWGIIGLAAVSIGNNIITFAVLVWTGRALIGRIGSKKPDRALLRSMVGESWPLMLNHFLATIFFQVDIVILQALKGAVIVGQYSVAYRWILAINIVPAFFTQALFPVLSRQASEDLPAFRRNYALGVKLLVMAALPLAVFFTFAAYGLTVILGGQQYVPDGAIALQLMIWSIPVGWMNSLTQYALIALNLQRYITRAFFLAVAFNIIVNIIFIPAYSYPAAAIATIASEIALFIPFIFLMNRAVGRVDWLDILWRPTAAASVMMVVTYLLWPVQPLGALLLGGMAYLLALIWLKPLKAEENAVFTPLLPAALRDRPWVKTAFSRR